MISKAYPYSYHRYSPKNQHNQKQKTKIEYAHPMPKSMQQNKAKTKKQKVREITNHCQQIPTKASLVTPPTPSRSNSSIIALNSYSSSPVSPNSLATRLKSSKSIYPFVPSSNSSNARRISSRGSRSRIFNAVTAWKAVCGMRRLEGCCGFVVVAGLGFGGCCCCCCCCWPGCCWAAACWAACCCTCGRGTP